MLWSNLKNVAQSNLEAIYGASRQGDVRDSLADITKGQELLGYKPALSVTDGFQYTWEYFINKNN